MPIDPAVARRSRGSESSPSGRRERLERRRAARGGISRSRRRAPSPPTQARYAETDASRRSDSKISSDIPASTRASWIASRAARRGGARCRRRARPPGPGPCGGLAGPSRCSRGPALGLLQSGRSSGLGLLRDRVNDSTERAIDGSSTAPTKIEMRRPLGSEGADTSGGGRHISRSVPPRPRRPVVTAMQPPRQTLLRGLRPVALRGLRGDPAPARAVWASRSATTRTPRSAGARQATAPAPPPRPAAGSARRRTGRRAARRAASAARSGCPRTQQARGRGPSPPRRGRKRPGAPATRAGRPHCASGRRRPAASDAALPARPPPPPSPRGAASCWPHQAGERSVVEHGRRPARPRAPSSASDRRPGPCRAATPAARTRTTSTMKRRQVRRGAQGQQQPAPPPSSRAPARPPGEEETVERLPEDVREVAERVDVERAGQELQDDHRQAGPRGAARGQQHEEPGRGRHARERRAASGRAPPGRAPARRGARST